MNNNKCCEVCTILDVEDIRRVDFSLTDTETEAVVEAIFFRGQFDRSEIGIEIAVVSFSGEFSRDKGDGE